MAFLCGFIIIIMIGINNSFINYKFAKLFWLVLQQQEFNYQAV